MGSVDVGFGDVKVRGAVHKRNIQAKHLVQVDLFDNGSLPKAQARGLEAELMGKMGGPSSMNPNTGLLNRARSFTPDNPNAPKYIGKP